MMSTPFTRFLSVSLLVVFGLAGSAFAQEGASISGSIVDPLGARVGGASTKLLLDGNVVRDGTADSRGDFKFAGVAEGRYQVEVSSPGFQTRTTDPVFVARGASVTVDVALPLGPLEQSV